ncbi:MAG: bifunctional metallophosphatase/5'-nucleotidase [Flavobacteriaceae bacterium]|nr:bifunctional metallophosphatase/5'-nucleotidase [Flavobacteriaceae bacterium]
MQKFKYLFIVVIFTISLSCGTTRQTVIQPNLVDDGKISFTFLQLNDVYEIAPLEGGKVGGMARAEYVHKELLKENPNTYLFMAGDFLNPSLLGAMKYNGERIRGKQMIEVMNAMNFELVAFGNHEFDISKSDLQKRLNESTFNWTSANARQKVCGNTYPFYKERNGIKEFVSDTHIINVEDADGTQLKIGFFSVVIPSNPQNYVEYTDMYTQAKRAYKSLKEKADVVFGLTHVSINQDKKIAELLKDIPLIMGGHEHNNMLVEVGSTKIAKADANAKTVYIHRINYDKNKNVLQLTSELLPITDNTQSDVEVAGIIAKWNAVLENQIKLIIENPNEVIYSTNIPLDGRDIPIRSTQTNLGKLIAKAMAYGFNNEVDCALVNGGSIRLDDQLMGDINSVDIFRVLPFGGGILKVELKGSLLKEVLDYGKSKAGTGAYLQRYNADFDAKTNEWKINGKPINDDKIYKVAFSDYLLKGRDIPFLKPDNKEIIKIFTPTNEEMGNDIRKTIIKYLKSLK